jgi:hypothetical protein
LYRFLRGGGDTTHQPRLANCTASFVGAADLHEFCAALHRRSIRLGTPQRGIETCFGRLRPRTNHLAPTRSGDTTHQPRLANCTASFVGAAVLHEFCAALHRRSLRLRTPQGGIETCFGRLRPRTNHLGLTRSGFLHRSQVLGVASLSRAGSRVSPPAKHPLQPGGGDTAALPTQSGSHLIQCWQHPSFRPSISMNGIDNAPVAAGRTRPSRGSRADSGG